MTKLIQRLTTKGRKAARDAYKSVETTLLVAEGRRSIKKKVRTANAVGRKAAKAGLIAGTAAAATVVIRAIRKRRALD